MYIQVNMFIYAKSSINKSSCHLRKLYQWLSLLIIINCFLKEISYKGGYIIGFFNPPEKNPAENRHMVVLRCNVTLARDGLASKFTRTYKQVHPYLQTSSLVPASKFIPNREWIHLYLRAYSLVLVKSFTHTCEWIYLKSQTKGFFGVW